MSADLHLVVPGALNRHTGGSLYDARMMGELRALGWRIQVHELAGRFPGPDREAEAALDEALDPLTDDGDAAVVPMEPVFYLA